MKVGGRRIDKRKSGMKEWTDDKKGGTWDEKKCKKDHKGVQ